MFALCESTSIYHLFAIVFILFVIVFVTITFGSAEMEDDEVVLEGNRRDLRRGLPDSQLGAVPGSARSEPGRTSASLSAQVQTWLDQMEHPTQMLQFAARTKWRYGDGENEEGLPTFTTLCGRKWGLCPRKCHRTRRLAAGRGFRNCRSFTGAATKRDVCGITFRKSLRSGIRKRCGWRGARKPRGRECRGQRAQIPAPPNGG